MKKTRAILIIALVASLGILGILVPGKAAVSQQTAGELFEKALYVEEGQGDLQKAIGLYQDIVKRFPESREVAAKAQLHIGLCYEKLGLKEAEKAFREAYNCDQLEGLGERDYLWGVAPVHLFLRTVGIRIVSDRKVWLTGYNPSPWPVTVRWRGVSVTKAGHTSVIRFPSGKEVVVSEEGEQMVEDT